jgi:non-ribosomal peptide synthetase component F
MAKRKTPRRPVKSKRAKGKTKAPRKAKARTKLAPKPLARPSDRKPPARRPARRLGARPLARTAPMKPLFHVSAYDADLDRNPANYQPLTPTSFLERAARVFPERLAVIHGRLRRNYDEFYARSRRLASALARRGIRRGDTVAAMMANTPGMLELHYGVPMTGGVLNTLNTRLDAPTLAFMLDHGEAKALVTDREFAPTIKQALALAKNKPFVIDYDDREFPQTGEMLGSAEYEEFIAGGDPDFAWAPPRTNGTRSRSTTPRARRAIPRASFSTIAARR